MRRSILAATFLIPLTLAAGEVPDVQALIASLSDAAAGSDKAEVAEKRLAADDSDAAFARYLEAWRLAKDPDAELRLARLIQADQISQATCIVTGKITALKDVNAKRCRCGWGSAFWGTLAPDRVLKGPELIRQCTETYAIILGKDHHHLPVEAVKAGQLVIFRKADYDREKKAWHIAPMEVGEEGIWLLKAPSGPEGLIQGPLGYEKLPLSKLPRVEAALAALKEKAKAR